MYEVFNATLPFRSFIEVVDNNKKKNLKKIKFEDLKDDKDIFFGHKNIQINSMMILTGKNGCGKTKFLKMLEKNCLREKISTTFDYHQFISKEKSLENKNFKMNNTDEPFISYTIKCLKELDIQQKKNYEQSTNIDNQYLEQIKTQMKTNFNEKLNVNIENLVDKEIEEHLKIQNEYERLLSAKQVATYLLMIKKYTHDTENVLNSPLCAIRKIAIDIILLDEPDRHLEPKLIEIFYSVLKELSRLGIQIFMTTHRPDTISLADPDTIWTIDLDKQTHERQIKKCHKFSALFKLTYNLRELMNFKIKVYVESHIDFKFYEIMYGILMKYSNEIRKQNSQLTSQDRFKSCGFNENRILSRRYQLEFCSSAKTLTGGGGGKNVLMDFLRRELKSIDQNSEPDYSFLINRLDNFPDIKNKIQQLISKNKLTSKDDFEENEEYVYRFKEEKPVTIKYPKVLKVLKGHLIEKVFEDEFSNGLIRKIDNQIDELFKYFKDNFKKELKINDKDALLFAFYKQSLTSDKHDVDAKLQETFDIVFRKIIHFILTKHPKIFFNESDYFKKIKMSDVKELTNISSELKEKIQEMSDNLNFFFPNDFNFDDFEKNNDLQILSNKFMLENDKTYENTNDLIDEMVLKMLNDRQNENKCDKYPKIFANIQQNQIGEISRLLTNIFECSSYNCVTLGEKILEKLNEMHENMDKLFFFPLDLAENFFDLNKKVREQIREIIKEPY
ncbi:AAA ATPase domain [Brachionus plicatilis]|uniref:AAA ATPase domain n=1 Tax=Brachionus plicatilis TaxID=10195 RepID=A0A3M7SJI6_BRAPC|nr:AAA ATPase domain [Brachionus plicatilis]